MPAWQISGRRSTWVILVHGLGGNRADTLAAIPALHVLGFPILAITYRNDCNRSVIFYYCVIDPQRSEVAPCRRIISGTKRIVMQGSRGQTFLTKEMEPRTSYDIKLWGGSRIKWAACDAELGGLESFQPKGNAALDFSYECNE